jgi:spore coat protein U-like protein
MGKLSHRIALSQRDVTLPHVVDAPHLNFSCSSAVDKVIGSNERAPVMIKSRRLRDALVLAAVAVCFPFAVGQAAAATLSSAIGITATVEASCTFTAANLDFGIYSGSQKDASTTITVTCTNSTPYNVGLLAGAGTGATVANRMMTGTNGTVNRYSLFKDADRSNPWGMTVGSDTMTGSGNGNPQGYVIYGRMPAGQFVTPGAYNDSITATVTY